MNLASAPNLLAIAKNSQYNVDMYVQAKYGGVGGEGHPVGGRGMNCAQLEAA